MPKWDNIRELLVILWIISAVMDCLIYLPVLHYKLQLFEFLFCVLFFTSLKPLHSFLRRPFPLKWPLFAFLVLIVLNMVFHREQHVRLENLGTGYSCLIPIVATVVLLQLKNARKVIEKGILGISILLPLFCFTGWLLYQLGWSDSMVKVYGGYPYLGTVVRVVGLTNSPNKVVAFAAIAIFYLLFVPTSLSKQRSALLIGGLLVTTLFTFSKEVVIIPVVLLLVWLFQYFRSSLVPYTGLIAAALLLTFFTYFYVTTGPAPPERQDIIYPQAAAEFGAVTLYPTSYYFLFRSSRRMIRESPLVGVGFGNYITTVEEHQQRGQYPRELYSYEAHDNYAGLAAQYGIGYIIVVVWLMISLKRLTGRLPLSERHFFVAGLLFFLLFGCIYFSYHMRLMWLFIGFVQYKLLQLS